MDLTAYINASGISRADLCAKAGISRAHLSLIEAGERKIGPQKVRGLADALGLSIRDLRPDLANLFGETTVSPRSEGAA
jgi:transcriptional regulator with XRE-family HTH domain